MTKSPETSLYAALAAAQAEMANASLDGNNPHFKSRYATLASVRDIVIPALSKHGIAVTQVMDISDTGHPVLRTTLWKGDDHIDSIFPVTCDLSKPQSIGSYITYARRYSLSAIACVGAADHEDDDGNAAEEDANNKRRSDTTMPSPFGSRTAAQANARAQMVKHRETADRLLKQISNCHTLDELDIEVKAVGFRQDLNELQRANEALASEVIDAGKKRRAVLTEASNDANFPVGATAVSNGHDTAGV